MFMEIPKGCDIPGHSPKDWVFNVPKNIYGGKDSGRVWYLYLRAKLESIGFTVSKHDDCVFFKDSSMYVLYTDDSILVGPELCAVERPNILWISCEDISPHLGCYGHERAITPTLDNLAARGIRFGQAVCNVPMCVPSRYSMMLGLYPSQSGVRHNSQVIPTDAMLPAPVLPERLRQLGYQTVGIGKTHWYSDGDVEGIERSRRGFEIRAIARGVDYPEAEPGATMMAEADADAYAEFRKETAPYGRGEENVAGYTGRTSAIARSRSPCCSVTPTTTCR